MHIPLLAGRLPDASDFGLNSRAVVVSRAFAQRFLAGRNPLGMHIYSGERNEKEVARQIVGIVGDTKYYNLRTEILPTTYFPESGRAAEFELRTAGNPAALMTVVRRVVYERAKDVPVFAMRTQTEQIDSLLMNERLLAGLSSLFGLLALLLACVGVYGLLSYEFGRRVREIGIRMALGAKRSELLAMVVRDGLRLSMAGLAIGAVAALVLTRSMASLLFGVGAADPATFGIIGLLLITVTVVASFIPARRSARLDPMVALRND